LKSHIFKFYAHRKNVYRQNTNNTNTPPKTSLKPLETQKQPETRRPSYDTQFKTAHSEAEKPPA